MPRAPCNNALVPTSSAELGSISTLLDELRQRVTTAADAMVDTDKEDVASELFEVDRALRMAIRRLEKASRSMR
ncbi:MAG: hypothetical protein GY925_00070 [Actinomycetia bacterium]|nr:hypothetical protein [Actinomycetes bacterium]